MFSNRSEGKTMTNTFMSSHNLIRIPRGHNVVLFPHFPDTCLLLPLDGRPGRGLRHGRFGARDRQRAPPAAQRGLGGGNGAAKTTIAADLPAAAQGDVDLDQTDSDLSLGLRQDVLLLHEVLFKWVTGVKSVCRPRIAPVRPRPPFPIVAGGLKVRLALGRGKNVISPFSTSMLGGENRLLVGRHELLEQWSPEGGRCSGSVRNSRRSTGTRGRPFRVSAWD